MHYGIALPNMGLDAQSAVSLAQDAEEAGWEAVLLWDCIDMGREHAPTLDPWILLAAIAATTKRIRIGPIVTPLSRRRPWRVARETVTLDHLSNGRVVLPIGLGEVNDSGFSKVGERTDRKVRARRSANAPFDIVFEGETPGDNPEQAASIVRPYAEAGVTWWLESIWRTPETQGGVEGMRKRIQQGPPL